MAENIENNGCSQRDNAEHEGYVESVQVIQSDMERKRQCTAETLEGSCIKITFNRAYKES